METAFDLWLGVMGRIVLTTLPWLAGLAVVCFGGGWLAWRVWGRGDGWSCRGIGGRVWRGGNGRSVALVLMVLCGLAGRGYGAEFPLIYAPALHHQESGDAPFLFTVHTRPDGNTEGWYWSVDWDVWPAAYGSPEDYPVPRTFYRSVANRDYLGLRTEGSSVESSDHVTAVFPLWPSSSLVSGWPSVPDGQYRVRVRLRCSRAPYTSYVLSELWNVVDGVFTRESPEVPPPPPGPSLGGLVVQTRFDGASLDGVAIHVYDFVGAAYGSGVTSGGSVAFGDLPTSGNPFRIVATRAASEEPSVPALSGQVSRSVVDQAVVTVVLEWDSDGSFQGDTGSGESVPGWAESLGRWFLDRLRELMRSLFVPSDEAVKACVMGLDELAGWGPAGLIQDVVSLFQSSPEDRLAGFGLPKLAYSVGESGGVWTDTGKQAIDLSAVWGGQLGPIRAVLGAAVYISAAVAVVRWLWPRQVV